jgi:hypothetical protein
MPFLSGAAKYLLLEATGLRKCISADVGHDLSLMSAFAVAIGDKADTVCCIAYVSF